MQKATLIGAGKLAHHLGLRLTQQGVAVNQVYSRTKKKAQQLAKLLKAKATNHLEEIESGADLYIIAVSDSAIEIVAAELAKTIDPSKAFVVHTSGATLSLVLKPYFKHYGVFYPLQSFSMEKEPDFTNIPICIDAHHKADKNKLEVLAHRISNKVFTINDEQRAVLHVAAVFVNNFTNVLYQSAAELVESKNIPFDLLRPLLLETALKVQAHQPKDMQTGPAIRKDSNTIKKHLSFLKKEHPELFLVYLQLTQLLYPDFKP
jgi:predicted short-subunit dehydrogenase-like oxidoreductase (DUF2520 family)